MYRYAIVLLVLPAQVIEYLVSSSPFWGANATLGRTRAWKGANSEAANSTDPTQHGWGVAAWEVPAKAKVIVRPDYQKEPPHFDARIWSSPEEGYPIFVDLWLMAHAMCHATGVGGFGRWASVLSGNHRQCNSRHRDDTRASPSCATPAERKAWKSAHPTPIE